MGMGVGGGAYSRWAWPVHGRRLCGQHYMSYKHLDMKWLLCLPQRNGFLVGIGSVRMCGKQWQPLCQLLLLLATAAAADTVVFVVIKTMASL